MWQLDFKINLIVLSRKVSTVILNILIFDSKILFDCEQIRILIFEIKEILSFEKTIFMTKF